MQTFTWNPDSAIESLQVKASTSTGVEAMLHPSAHAGDGSLVNLPDALRHAGMEVGIQMVGRTPSLRIRSFKSEVDVVSIIEQSGAVNPCARQVEASPAHGKNLEHCATSQGHSH